MIDNTPDRVRLTDNPPVAEPDLGKQSSFRTRVATGLVGVIGTSMALLAVGAPAANADGSNPLKGVKPGLGPLQSAMGTNISNILAIIWFFGIVLCVIALIRGTAEFASSRANHRYQNAADGAADIGIPIVGLILIFALPAVIEAFLGIAATT